MQRLTTHPATREGAGLAECEDKLLLAGFVRGEREAFERVVARYQPRVARLAWRLLGWRGELDDVVQDVFLAVLESRHKYRGDNNLWPWIAAITVNRCRSRQRRWRLRLRWLAAGATEAPAHPPPEGQLLRDETGERVRRALRALPTRDREVIVLYYLEECSAGEIAALLAISANAVDVQLHRARKRLKELLEAYRPD